MELSDILGQISLLGHFEIPTHTSVLPQINSLGQDRMVGSFLPHTIPALSLLFLSVPIKKKKKIKDIKKKIVQANQFCFDSSREQRSSTPTVKTEALRGQKHPRD